MKLELTFPDMQMVSLTLRVMSRPDTSKLSVVYQNLGLDYDERVLPSIGNEVLKAIVAQFDGKSTCNTLLRRLSNEATIAGVGKIADKQLPSSSPTVKSFLPESETISSPAPRSSTFSSKTLVSHT